MDDRYYGWCWMVGVFLTFALAIGATYWGFQQAANTTGLRRAKVEACTTLPDEGARALCIKTS